jgi:SAM-dependent methyltransferase
MVDNADAIIEWNGPTGDSWAKLQAKFDVMTGPFGQAALRAAAAQLGERVLDVGCGCGTTSFELAKAIGPAGSVLGVDISQPMLDVAKGNAAGSANIAFQEADASTALLPQDRDLLFSRFGVMFFDKPLPAFAHLHATLKSSGRMAFCCWRTPKENPWASVPIMALREALNITDPPPPPTSPGPFAFADADRLRGILTEAGFKNIGIEPFDAPIRLGGSVHEAALSASTMGPASRLVLLAGEDARPKAVTALNATFTPLAAADGAVALTGAVWIVTASAG